MVKITMGKLLMLSCVVLSCFILGVWGQACNPPCPADDVCERGKCVQLTNCECAANPKALVKCTYQKNTGDDAAACAAAGCCWYAKKGKCHTKNTLPRTKTCTVPVAAGDREEAGWGKISPNDCMCVGGCYDDSVKSYWCYVPVEPIELNKVCTDKDVCRDPNAECRNGKCKCKSGFYEKDGVCEELIDLDGDCGIDGKCKDPNASCQNGKCSCNAGYVAQNGVCVEEADLGEACGKDAVCKDPNAVCSNNVCTCKAGYVAKNGVCVEEVDLNQPCSANSICKDPNASCQGGACKCNAGFADVAGVCTEEADLGEACGANIVCKDPNAECSGGVCTCKADYFNQNGVCAKGIPTNDPCTAGDICADPNAECVNGKCRCKEEFNFRDGVCKEICKKRVMDIIFVLDNSGSIDATEMAKQKNFMQKLVASFTIQDDNTRVGIVNYGTDAEDLNPLNAENSFAAVSADIAGITDRTNKAWTNTPDGLNHMSAMYNAQGGNNQKLAVLLTDGFTNRGDINAAIANIPNDVDMFCVGVDGYHQSELEAIASTPDFVYTTDQFDALISLIPELREDLCPP